MVEKRHAFVCCPRDLNEPQSSVLEFDFGGFNIMDGFSVPQQGRLQHFGSSEKLFALLQCATVGLVTVLVSFLAVWITVNDPDGIARPVGSLAHPCNQRTAASLRVCRKHQSLSWFPRECGRSTRWAGYYPGGEG
jgi:hypothetical protein